MIYAHGYSENYEQERRRAQELSDLHKRLSDWQGCFRTRLEQWSRHGPSPALRASIAEAAKEVDGVVDQILNAPPPVLSPTKNRY